MGEARLVHWAGKSFDNQNPTARPHGRSAVTQYLDHLVIAVIEQDTLENV